MMTALTLPLIESRESKPPAGPKGSPLRRSLAIVTAGWVFGSVWVTATSGAPIALFAQGLKATPFQFGVLSALPFIASLLSMPASLLIERTGRRKWIFLGGQYLQRCLWLVIPIAPVWIVSRYGMGASAAAMSLLLGLTFIMHCGGAIGGPAWVSWMADIIPSRVHGKYFSRRRQWGIVSAIPAAAFVGWYLDRRLGHASSLQVLRGCAIIFLCSATFGIADIAMFQFLPDVPKPPQKGDRLLRALGEPLADRQFVLFAGFVATLTFAVSFMGQFVTLYLIDVVKVGNLGTQMMLLVAPLLVQLLVLPVWGAASDRMGKKPLLVIAALGLVPAGLGWCFLSASDQWLGYVLSAAGAALWTGVEVANFNFVMEFAGSGDARGGSSFVAVNSVIINIAGCLGGLSAGLIAQALSRWHWQPSAFMKTFSFYDVLFVLSAFLRLAAVALFLPCLHEPRARPAREALRYMSGNIYNNLFNAVLQPLRFVRLRRKESYAAEREDTPGTLARLSGDPDPALRQVA